MHYDFDRRIDRRHTRSYKWDQSEKLFGDPDILPLWVADMDFYAPPEVREALEKRAALGVYGYSFRESQYVEAIIDWYARRHQWQLQPEWIVDSPSVVTSLSLAIEQFTEPGDQVVLQSPVYYPFYDVIRSNGRVIADNPLLLRDGQYEMDLAQLETLFANGAKMLLLCNPHNPGGRVWEREQLLALGALCEQYDIIVVSDEIHGDLALPGYTYTPFATLSPALEQRTISCLAATKTFNLPGLHTSYIVTANETYRRKLDHRIRALAIHMSSHFAHDGIEAALRHGEPWLNELLEYVSGNLQWALGHLAAEAPAIVPMRPQGTYLLWIDCRALGLDKNGLKDLMFKQAKVAFNEGSMFGAAGEGWLRINLACPRSLLEEALTSFTKAVQSL